METDSLMPPFKRFARLVGEHVVRPYYSGPFWHYECLREEGATWDIEPLLRALPPPNQATLEIGSGAGRVAFKMAEAGHLVTAMDSSEESLRALQSRQVTPLLISTICGDVLVYGRLGQFDLFVVASLSINLFNSTTILSLIDFIKTNALPKARFCFGVFDDDALSSFERYDNKVGSSIFFENYLDEERNSRLMISAIDYNKYEKEIKQNWMVDMIGSSLYSPRYQIAYTNEHLWTFSEINKIMVLAGFALEHDEPAKIYGGGASDQHVHMVRYVVPCEP